MDFSQATANVMKMKNSPNSFELLHRNALQAEMVKRIKTFACQMTLKGISFVIHALMAMHSPFLHNRAAVHQAREWGVSITSTWAIHKEQNEGQGITQPVPFTKRPFMRWMSAKHVWIWITSSKGFSYIIIIIIKGISLLIRNDKRVNLEAK